MLKKIIKALYLCEDFLKLHQFGGIPIENGPGYDLVFCHYCYYMMKIIEFSDTVLNI